MQTVSLASRMVCAGCGVEAAERPDRGEYPFRCRGARSGDDIDHVLARRLDVHGSALFGPDLFTFADPLDSNPFVSYRMLLHSWHVARKRGMSDGDYIDVVRALDRRVAEVDGRGFTATPFGRQAELAALLGFSGGGAVWVKDETQNVAGSHKGRHLMGIMIYLKVLEVLGIGPSPEPALAIASCGNAALAAAVVARAGGRRLRVFIPPDAPRPVVIRLHELGADTITCGREAGGSGDPTYLRFLQEVDGGAIPFCCQGNANGMTIEGGETLGFEMVSALGTRSLDAIVVQVGGGALASAVVQSLSDAHALGGCSRLPRLYTVQTCGAFPLKRAFDRLFTCVSGAAAASHSTTLERCLAYAVRHRHEFMWPWEEEPRSVARGILDDETYDWLAVAGGMLRTGGNAVVVSEEELESAYALARSVTGINVDHTGAAGLAGLMQLAHAGAIAPHENVAVIFSGVERSEP